MAQKNRKSYPAATNGIRYIEIQNNNEARMRREREFRRRRRIQRRKRNIFFIKLAIGTIFLVTVMVFGSFLLHLLFPVKTSAPEELAIKEVSQMKLVSTVFNDKTQGIDTAVFNRHPAWEENFLTISEYARPGTELRQVKNIFVHYTANAGTSAAQNHSYFEQLKDTHETSVSAHFIIGYQGEIIQCVPLNEMAYAVQTRNEDSISIECCHLTEDGAFTPETYNSLIELLEWLTEAYGLEEEDILRHYDCGGKKCPLYYTDHEDAWRQLKEDVREA